LSAVASAKADRKSKIDSEAYSQKPEIIEAFRNGRADVLEISDRQNDITEGLIVIADVAGGDWPSKVRKSLIELFSAKEEDNVGVQLLASCRVAFGEGQDCMKNKWSLVHPPHT
jgi:Protein of unknown function (DUF3631)